MIFHSERKLLAKVRKKFSVAPLGAWFSYFGGGEDQLHGCGIRFDEGKSGFFHTWGGGPDGDDEEEEYPLYWESVSERRIKIRLHRCSDPTPESCLIDYDFNLKRDKYKNLRIYIFEIGKQPVVNNERGFWISPHPLQMPVTEL